MYIYTYFYAFMHMYVQIGMSSDSLEVCKLVSALAVKVGESVPDLSAQAIGMYMYAYICIYIHIFIYLHIYV
jgi:hypothetical protein